MKNLMEHANYCINLLNDLGIYPNEISKWEINTRACRWGQCRKRKGGIYTINIAECLLRDDTSDKALHDTIIHEFLHAVDGCMEHKNKWKAFANIVNENTEYNISRVTSYAEKGFKLDPFNNLRNKETYKYMITCNECGNSWKYKRMSNIVNACIRNNAKCSCGGKEFTVTNLIDGNILTVNDIAV